MGDEWEQPRPRGYSSLASAYLAGLCVLPVQESCKDEKHEGEEDVCRAVLRTFM